MASLTPVWLTARHNRLLAALPDNVFAGIAPHLEPVVMPLGDVLYAPGSALHYAYFPTTAIVSLHYVLENGASAEVASVGNEGVVGISIFMGGDPPVSRAAVCTSGQGYRIRAPQLQEAFSQQHPLMHMLLRYTQALIIQISQTAVCNRHHSMEQQMCRWLLLADDRLHSQELVITQELIAHMLGVRREGITETAGALQRAGLISYHRGHIQILDRHGLEQHACECYEVVHKGFTRFLNAPDAPPENHR